MSPERKHYGEVPSGGVPHGVGDEPGFVVSITDAAVAWLTAGLSTIINRVPDRLRLPFIQPVLEVYRPILKFVDFPIPPAGQSFATLTVPDGLMWELLSISFRLVTSGVAANRAVVVQVNGRDQPGGQIPIFSAAGNFTQVASTTILYTASPLSALGAVLTQPVTGNYTNIVLIPIPPRVFVRGAAKGLTLQHVADQVFVGGVALDPGDQMSQGRMVVLESPAMVA